MIWIDTAKLLISYVRKYYVSGSVPVLTTDTGTQMVTEIAANSQQLIVARIKILENIYERLIKWIPSWYGTS